MAECRDPGLGRNRQDLSTVEPLSRNWPAPASGRNRSWRRRSPARRPAKSWPAWCSGWPTRRSTRAAAASWPSRLVGSSTARPAASCSASCFSNLHRLRIGTLDSFFVRLAGSFTLELGLPTGWRIVEDLDDRQWRLEAIRRVLAAGKTSEMLALVHLLFKGETTRSISQQIGGLVASLYDVYCESDAAAWHRLSRPPRLPADELTAAIERLAAAGQPANGHQANAWRDDIARARSDDWESFIAKGVAGKLAGGEEIFHGKPIEPELAELYKPLLLMPRGAGRPDRRPDRGDLQIARSLCRPVSADQTPAVGAAFRRRAAAAGRRDRWPAACGRTRRGGWTDRSRIYWSTSFKTPRSPSGGCCGRWPRPAARRPGRRSFFSVGDVKQAIYRWRGGRLANLRCRQRGIARHRRTVAHAPAGGRARR